jgi:CRISPR-associated protein Cas2
MTKNHCVLSYDIVDSKRRRKMATTLEGMGIRVQYSVFEAWLTNGQIRKLIKAGGAFIKTDEGDSFRVYRLCASCYPKRISIGGPSPDWEQPIIL